MKRIAFALRRPTHIGGNLVKAGTVVAVVESEFPIDSVFSLAGQMGLEELSESQIEAKQEEPEVIVEEVPEEALVGGDLADLPPAIETQPEIAGGTLLTDAGMSEALHSRLARNNITTVEQLTEFVNSGGDLVGLQDIGITYAKRIVGWLNNRNQ
jgi:hypothetical protein